jgi:hypothetical protein
MPLVKRGVRKARNRADLRKYCGAIPDGGDSFHFVPLISTSHSNSGPKFGIAGESGISIIPPYLLKS